MKLREIIKRVRTISGDNQSIQFSDEDIKTWVNDAMRECAADNQLLQKDATTSVLANTQSYSTPPDILKIHSVRLDGQVINIIEFKEAQDRNFLNTDRGTPIACWIWAGKVNFYPVPDNNLVGKPLVISYTRTPSDLEGDADEPELPAVYHMRLVDYCLAQVAQQDDDLNRYAMKMQEFRTGIQTLKDLPENRDDVYPSMSVSPRDYGNSYYDEWVDW